LPSLRFYRYLSFDLAFELRSACRGRHVSFLGLPNVDRKLWTIAPAFGSTDAPILLQSGIVSTPAIFLSPRRIPAPPHHRANDSVPVSVRPRSIHRPSFREFLPFPRCTRFSRSAQTARTPPLRLVHLTNPKPSFFVTRSRACFVPGTKRTFFVFPGNFFLSSFPPVFLGPFFSTPLRKSLGTFFLTTIRRARVLFVARKEVGYVLSTSSFALLSF